MENPWDGALGGLNVTFHGLSPLKCLGCCPRISWSSRESISMDFFRDLGSSTGRREFQGASMEKGHCEENSKVFSMKKKGHWEGNSKVFSMEKGHEEEDSNVFPWKREMGKKFQCIFCGKGDVRKGISRSFLWKKDTGREFQGASVEKGHGKEIPRSFSMKKGHKEGNSKELPWKRDMGKKLHCLFHGKRTQERNSNVFSMEKRHEEEIPLSFPWKKGLREWNSKAFPCPRSFFHPKYSHPVGTSSTNRFNLIF